MPVTGLPMDGNGVPVTPSLPSQIPVSVEFQQTLALLLGMFQQQRVPVSVGQSGVLRVNDAVMFDATVITATSGNFDVAGTPKAVSSVLVKAHPDNTGLVWVRANAAATTANAWPLEAGEGINIGIDDYQQFHALIVNDTEKLIVAFIK